MTAPTLEIHLSEDMMTEALRHDARVGLTADPKWLPPKWFYDARGSELFGQITTLPEYYPTRTERALLTAVAGEIAEAAAPEMLVELGSGSAEKTVLLLDAFVAHGGLDSYVPQDVSPSALEEAAAQINDRFPNVTVHGVVSDFTGTLHHLPRPKGRDGKRMIAFLGGTIGNMVPDERAEFLTGVREVLDPGEHLLLGAGLVVDPAVLVPAYDDAAGVTAEFNRNVLRVLNARLDADFEPEAFRHVAIWDPEQEWIEMRLEASRDMRVVVRGLDLTVDFAAGEQLRTEISAKFRIAGLEGELAHAGFAITRHWTDPDERFALVLATAK
ncbi:L-histidine N(alpha)-methyltransferase [Aldersonia sp. NBC_00410]|uniref:L-histidine N(alpha)-methyltransferase n=1 Tax=Aldersonia sp. NBC_00410 TaxID=2975954 RepID=UPI00225B126F|nr:L-histidine N(alpha)-methyltransferase [Aldersonia sp. NBC_00410]MCX5045521.1 L-histidine N(alpha)-methyltransferase [Aldersonia sp. NBC_00410]